MRMRALIILILLSAPLISAQEWPMFQNDVTHSGRQTGKSSMNISEMGVIWAYKVSGIVQHTPVVADINNDGKLEVMVATTDGKLYAIAADGSTLWMNGTNLVFVSPPAVSPPPQQRLILVVTADGDVIARDQDGRVEWIYQSFKEVYATPLSIGDIDYNGVQDIMFDSIVLSMNRTRQGFDKVLLNSKGFAQGFELVANIDGRGYRPYGGSISNVPVVGDFKGDRRLGLVTLTVENQTGTGILLIQDDEGNILNTIGGLDSSSPPVTSDIEGTGRDDVIVCGGGGITSIINVLTGTVTGVNTASRSRCIYVVPADLNNDHKMELVTESADGTITLLGSVTDSDGEGLIDYVEDMKGTNKLKVDTDGDGIPDNIDKNPTASELIDRSSEFRNDSDKDKDDSIFNNPQILLILFVVPAAIIVFKRTEGAKGDSRTIGGSGRGGSSGVEKSAIRAPGGARKDPTRNKELGAQYGEKTIMLEKQWSTVMRGEAEKEDLKLLDWMMQVVGKGPISSDDLGKLLKVSNIKLAKHATKLEQMGYLKIDSASDPSNPMLTVTDKKWGG